MVPQIVPVQDKQVPTGAEEEELYNNEEAKPVGEEDKELEIQRLRSELKTFAELKQSFENY